MSYYFKMLEQTVNAINKCYDSKITNVNVKRVRKCNSISSKSHSKISIISRILDDLDKLGYIKFVSRNSPKNYRIIKKIDLTTIKEELIQLKNFK